MVISFHQFVDDAVGVLMALCGQVQINHGGVQTAVSQVLLDSADIDSGFQQMCGLPEADKLQNGAGYGQRYAF